MRREARSKIVAEEHRALARLSRATKELDKAQKAFDKADSKLKDAKANARLCMTQWRVVNAKKTGAKI